MLETWYKVNKNESYKKKGNNIRDIYIRNLAKMKIYTTKIRPIVTHAIETANITPKEKEQFKIFERKVSEQ